MLFLKILMLRCFLVDFNLLFVFPSIYFFPTEAGLIIKVFYI